MAQCASCHGDSGDGKGTRVLDRPARSFQAGGFSFGDTTESITRVVRSGIGGTPMPGFARTLSPAEIRNVVKHVRSLGPERVESKPNEAIVHVGDRPVVLRGKLPEVYMGMGDIPRGLLVGNPDGISMMYRTDDVRFLGTRQGAFARRTDWDGRGGTALELQGRLIHLVPDVPVFEQDGKAIMSRFLGTDVGGDRAAVRYQVGHATISETGGATTRGALAGYFRKLDVHDGSGVQLRLPSWRAGGLERIGSGGVWSWWQEPAFEGRMHFVGVRGAQPLAGSIIQLPQRGIVEIVVFPDTAVDVARAAGLPVAKAPKQATLTPTGPLLANMLCVIAMAAPTTAAEEQYYTLQSYTPPKGEVLEVGGLVFLPDGTLAASTRRGRVWLIDDPDREDPSTSPFTMHAEGLWEGLGLNQIDGDVLVLQRSEVSRLRDLDGDRVAERIDTVTNDWGITDNYHEFAFGMPRDADGNLYFSLNLAFLNPEWFHGKSNAKHRGWLVRLTPDGTVERFAMGFRSPAGVGIDAEGRVLVTDNQGDWMASSPIYAVKEGGFHGHPGSLRWTEAWGNGDVIPEDKTPPEVDRVPPAIWIPYDWSRSTGNLVPDLTQGTFGPFEKQLFVAELTNGMILRAELEDIDGITQGAIWPFRQQVGSACRVMFSPKGNLVIGMTNRGWGGLGPGHGLRRLDWTGETPMEMLHCRAVPGGFDIEFTRPVQGQVVASQVHARDYDYHWWWEYGSPE
jgi:glucose/arabinose dehydrogenase